MQSELIFPAQDKHCHGSSIVECPNGDLRAVWFYGSGERSADDVIVQGARRKAHAKEWSPVFTAADTPGFPDCNPVLYIDAKQKLWLFYVPVLAHAWQDCMLKYRTSVDYQKKDAPNWSWQDVIVLKPGDDFAKNIKAGLKELDLDEGMWSAYAPKYSELLAEAATDLRKCETGWMTRIHPLTLPSGRMLLPLYSDGFNLSIVAITDDAGQTWRASKPIVGLGPIQPSLVRKKDGTIAAYMRDSGMLPQRAQSATSKDDGETWSVARDTDLPNPSSSLEVVALKDGRWVMVFNDTEDGRHSLAISMSDDEGQSWKWKRHLELAEKGKGGFAYPSMIQARDRRIHITYTHNISEHKSIKHVALDPEWIKQGS
ncbi:MAG: exo-alpha-sialidase [Candidatus Hydrogenedentes bacterium]|nr:exo-alpha-sialidase [Candidatus Hydrogenedentota bacterium]